MKGQKIGKISKYFSKIGVAAIEIIEGDLSLGDKIHIKGTTTDFTQVVKSMQINGEPVEMAEEGDSVGVKVKDKVREGDEVYKA